MYRVLLALCLVASLAFGCSPPPGSDTGPDSGPDASMDSEPPEFRDLKVSIMGEFSSTSNLVNGNARRIVPIPVDAEFTVFATDSGTSSEDLEIELVDPDGTPIAVDSKSFSNGLWSLGLELSPGETVLVRARDGAGNERTSEHSLKLVSRKRALVSSWERRQYSNEAEPQIQERRSLEFKEDGAWSRELEEGKEGGTYRLEDGELDLRQTYKTAGADQDGNRGTVEVEVLGEFYVDDQFFSFRPWTRESGATSNVAGTWSRSVKVYGRNDDSRTLRVRIEETLELNRRSGEANTWMFTRIRNLPNGDETTSTASGTYETLELTTNYGNNYGTFLVRTTNKRNGSKLDSTETNTELYRTPLDKLLISPYVRGS